MKAGIIGGTGQMGKLFAGIFSRAGYEVLVSGRSTGLPNTDLAKECSIVIVSVPIRSTVQVIGEIAPVLAGDQLVCDLTSLKMEPVAAMKRSRAQVIGLHPMFGPTVRSLKGQIVVVCPERCDEPTLHNLLSIFRNEGAECTITTPEAHDRMMAVVQGLTHFVTLCMADTIRRMDLDVEKTRPFTSPVYQIELALAGRLLSQNADLYADILQQNPFTADVLASCRDAVGELCAVVASGDADLFAKFFGQNAQHFGKYCAAGMEQTDAIIDCMVNR
jgi:prephenate dehydrogenase